MEILTPKADEPQAPSSQVDSEKSTDVRFSDDQIDAIKYLGITDKIFDDVSMNKVKEITEYFKTGDLEPVDLKLGNPQGMDRLDKIYSYMRLCKQSDQIKQRELAIEQAKARFLTN